MRLSPTIWVLRILLVLLVLTTSACSVPAIATLFPHSESDSSEVYQIRSLHSPDGIGKFYMGREIAQVMGHQGADWLDRPERDKEEAPSKLMEALPIQAGDA